MKVQILIDNIKSFYIPYAYKLKEKIKNSVDSISIIHNHSDVVEGDILCLIGCEKLFKNLKLNKSNIVVHESWLPKGKGWSPLSWQVIEGENEIPVTLFEASNDYDTGKIYLQESIKLTGNELFKELKHKQGLLTNNLIKKYILSYPNIKGKEQHGESTYYKRRTPKDSELNINKSIDEQFNLLRVVDNNNYPAFFIKNNIKYILKIEKDNE